MTMSVRCKLFCKSKSSAYPGQGSQVVLEAVYPGETGVKATDYENAMFGRATPNASMTMFVQNPTAEEQFQAGKFYYIDFTEVPADRQKP
jgi:hypothetical protein